MDWCSTIAFVVLIEFVGTSGGDALEFRTVHGMG